MKMSEWDSAATCIKNRLINSIDFSTVILNICRHFRKNIACLILQAVKEKLCICGWYI